VGSCQCRPQDDPRRSSKVRVFLSYRRADVGGYAGRIGDTLRQRLGPRGVFHDVAAIAPGEDFLAATDRAIDECDAVLVIIGPGWLVASTGEDAPRLFQAEDYVRLELQRALQREARILPVLVGNAAMPTADDWPEELRELSRRQAVVLHDASWSEDVEGLVRAVRGEQPKPARRKRWLTIAAPILIVLVLTTTGILVWRSNVDNASSPPLPGCGLSTGTGWRSLSLDKHPTGVIEQPNGTFTITVSAARWRTQDDGWQVQLTTTLKNDTTESVTHGEWKYKDLLVAQRPNRAICFSADPTVVDPNTVGEAEVGFAVRCKPDGLIQLVTEDRKETIAVTDHALDPGTC